VNRNQRAEELETLRLALAQFALRLDAFEKRLKDRQAKTSAEPSGPCPVADLNVKLLSQ
jgi:hypothetical protein